jgi:hypothetical protein
MSDHQFVLMWDMYGLEYCEDITEIEQQVVWHKLKNPDTASPARVPNLLHLQLRARYNSQRHYEIYLVTAQAGVTKDQIISMFEDNPQAAAELIRKHGYCYHDDRPSHAIKIT